MYREPPESPEEEEFSPKSPLPKYDLPLEIWYYIKMEKLTHSGMKEMKQSS